jgi:hypothetical protein
MTKDELRVMIRQELWKALSPEMRERHNKNSDEPRMYSSGLRRRKTTMCPECVEGKHHNCESFRCPCVCNDEAWDRTTAAAPGATVMA